jgi:class 3 adenylate cyclase
MAGVIGAKRLTYDVWGDTVNLAARLENRGEPGRIHVSDHTRKLLEGTYVLERRGPLDLKGFGVEQTWYLVGPHGSAATRVAACATDLTPSRP